MQSETDNNVWTVKTVQIAPFKTMITAMKEFIVETNVDITPKGISIVNMDKSHTIVVNINLPAEKFELYDCKKERIVIGLKVSSLFKFLSVLENNETLTMYIAKEDYNDGIVSRLMLKFENEDKGVCIVKGMKLIDTDTLTPKYPDITFTTEINMPSSEFQKNIKNLKELTDRIEIKSVGNEVRFSGKGELGTSEACYRGGNEGNVEIHSEGNANKIIQGEFSLKHLSYFTKCTGLCNQVSIFLENDVPLVVKYRVASLGTMEFGIAALPSTS